jgi:hypothetical protein
MLRGASFNSILPLRYTPSIMVGIASSCPVS